jgi:hypothetical protein
MTEPTQYTYFEEEDEACFNDLCACGHGRDMHGDNERCPNVICGVDGCTCEKFVE